MRLCVERAKQHAYIKLCASVLSTTEEMQARALGTDHVIMSETSAESPRAPLVRPPSSISVLAERLKCSNLQDTPYDLGLVEPADLSQARFIPRARRPKAVNFTNEEVYDIIPINQQRSATPSDVDGSSATCDSGNEDSSESWVCATLVELCVCRRTRPNALAFSELANATPSYMQPLVCVDAWRSIWLAANVRARARLLCLCQLLTLARFFSPSSPPSFSSACPLLSPSHRRHRLICKKQLRPVVRFPSHHPPAALKIVMGSRLGQIIIHQPYNIAHRLETNEEIPSRYPPLKRSCRSQSASSNQKLASGTGSRRTIARPIALRISQRALYSPATTNVSTTAVTGISNSALSSTAYALVASGCVKLRNANTAVHQPSSTTSRLSWHHPIASGNRRYVIHPGPAGCSRHSVVFGSTVSELVGDVRLRKPPSLACISSSASNAGDFSHHRLSAFTPTTQSRRMSLTGDEGESTNPITAFSPDTISSPCGGIAVPSSTSLPRPTVSAASSGFFQDSCSLSHSSCSSSTNSDQHPTQVGNLIHHCGLVSKPMDLKVLHFDDSTTSLAAFEHQQQQQQLLLQQHHSCAMEAAKLRCQSQPADAGGAPTCVCGSVASTECLSRQVGLKRRRCSHDVGLIFEADSGAFLFGSHQHTGSFDSASFNPDVAVISTTVETAMVGQETSVSPLRLQQQQQGQADVSVFPQDSETAFLMSCCRKELSGLSEASEEEESNEATLIQHQNQSCCALEEYDAGTLTPPPQTRFRPIAPSPSSEEVDAEADHRHNSCSTEGSPCSFKANSANIVAFSDDSDEDEVDDEDSFGGIAPGLNHRRRCSPMQTEEVSASAEKFRELDIDMIEQD
ncbi:hypothetical protein EGR_00345 [Echinococcus granulosus]|uniref:Uncharacterized protein n=1 Tax=Echinococcus granulosus TaxID=6210 RepID=W6UWP8_ECHGR|nr:hypothetical protein EGR_00345 [Echinococcus granulosus]EUB65076.1 hypothetical protein EGR_00345 [Echinococcus granulosus]